MITFSYFDKEKKRDYCTYDSSDIKYSEATENEDGTITLKVVFTKNNQTYIYYKVSNLDYIQMKNSDSNGKAFFVLIAKKNKTTNEPKYQYRRVEDTSEDYINSKIEELQKQALDDAEKIAKNDNTEQQQGDTQQQENKPTDIKNTITISYEEDKCVVKNENISQSYKVSNVVEYYKLSLFLSNILQGCNISVIVNDPS